MFLYVIICGHNGKGYQWNLQSVLPRCTLRVCEFHGAGRGKACFLRGGTACFSTGRYEWGGGAGGQAFLVLLVLFFYFTFLDFWFLREYLLNNTQNIFAGWSLPSLLKELGLLKKKLMHVSRNHLKSEAKYNLFPKLSIYRVCSIDNRSEIPVLACPKWHVSRVGWGRRLDVIQLKTI